MGVAAGERSLRQAPRGMRGAAAAGGGTTSSAVGVPARLHRRMRAPVMILTRLLVLMIGVSRVFAGVHWPTDVLAGFAAGGFVLVAGILAPGRDSRSPPA